MYNKGQFGEALKNYEAAYKTSPDSDIVNFNLGTALYKTKDYQKAISHFEKSLVSNNQSLEEKASYNLGNAKYKYGIGQEETNLKGAVRLLEQSLRHYERALEIEPEDKDARYNYDFVKKELERLKEKLKQQAKEQPQKQIQEQNQNQQTKSEPEETRKQEQQKPGEKPQTPEEQKENETPKPESAEPQQEKEGYQPPSGEEQRGPEQKEPEEKKTESPVRRGESGGIPEEMSEKEAQSLLENYRQEEEPKKLYKEEIPVRGLPEVIKDW